MTAGGPLIDPARSGGSEAPRTGWRGIGVAAWLVGCAGIVALVLVVGVGILVFVVGALDDDEGSEPGGARSERLEVTVTPRTGLDPDQEVRVRSTAFAAESIVAVTQCMPSADTELLGEAACDTDGGSRYAVGADGSLDVPYRVRRVITFGGAAVDCGTVTDGCIVVAADVGNYNRSGGQPVTFARGLPPILAEPSEGRAASLNLPVTVDPPAPYRDGQTVTVTASGFIPGEPVLVAWCSADFDRAGPVSTCEPEHYSEALGTLLSHTVEGVTRTADATGAVSFELPIKATVEAGGTIGAEPEAARPVACSEATPCRLVVAAAADFQRSAVHRYHVPG